MVNTDYPSSKRPKGWVSGNLPDPQLKGKMSLSDVLGQLENRKAGSLKRDDIGQVLWAGYGRKRSGKANKQILSTRERTVPSWNA